MRPTLRLLASIQKGAQYLEPGTPTGLAGLLTAASPRHRLLFLYNDTLTKLQRLPEHSVYRQSTEALTRHRLSIIERTVPSGLQEWEGSVKQKVDDHLREVDGMLKTIRSLKDAENTHAQPGDMFTPRAPLDQEAQTVKSQSEGPRTPGDVAEVQRNVGAGREMGVGNEPEPRLTPEQAIEVGSAFRARLIEEEMTEPPFTIEQVTKVENEIGAGLIEEVIAVAEGERSLVDTMLENEVYVLLADGPSASVSC